MHTENNIQDYLKTAGEQIRWKRARNPLLYELETHIMDRRDALIRQGIDENEAESAAVAEMGDPETVGLELDRIHRPRPDWFLIGGAAALFASGLLLLWFVGGATEQFSRMAICGGIGIVFMILGYFCDYTVLPRFAVPVFAVLCAVCTVFPIFGNAFLSTSTQLCYVLPLAFAGVVYSLKGRYKPYILSASACILLIIAALSANSASMLVYLFTTCSAVLIYAAVKGITDSDRFRAWLPPISFIAIFAFVILLALSDGGHHMLWRRFMEGTLNPEADPYGTGWVPLRIRELINTSVFVGEGMTSEFSEVFMHSSDFTLKEYTLTVASHKMGLIIFAAVCAVLFFTITAVIIGMNRQSCKLAKLVIFTVGVSFLLRIAAYIACNLGFPLISFDGIPLFSYNGKLMILDMFVIGLMLSVFRMESIARDSSCGRDTVLHS